jgi:hypothetical protein
VLLTVGCGPRLSAGPGAQSSSQAKPSETTADGEAPEPAETRAPASEPEPEPKPPVREVLAAPDKAWVFSFRGSAAYEQAEARCDARHSEDLAARARCITKARDAFTADAMEFTRDDAGRDVWVIYREKANRLIQVYSVPIEYGEQSEDRVRIKKVGRGRGKALLFPDVSEFDVQLSDEYTLQLEDSKHGRLSYDARLGLFTTGR